jgi:ubiquinone/menaquinone biosynthesis C-methylase UbiE
MGLRERFQIGLARQLGHPSGLRGRFVARALNRANLALVNGSVTASGVGPGQDAADIGFGGGVGLRALLDATAPSGTVHGVDISTTMVEQAQRAYAAECRAGRLHLATGSMLELPLADASLDAVITANTVYFLGDDDVGPAFREIVRVLRSGGRAVVGISDPDDMAKMPVTSHGFHLRPVDELLDAMNQAGFSRGRSEPLDVPPVLRHLLVGEI